MNNQRIASRLAVETDGMRAETEHRRLQVSNDAYVVQGKKVQRMVRGPRCHAFDVAAQVRLGAYTGRDETHVRPLVHTTQQAAALEESKHGAALLFRQVAPRFQVIQQFKGQFIRQLQAAQQTLQYIARGGTKKTSRSNHVAVPKHHLQWLVASTAQHLLYLRFHK